APMNDHPVVGPHVAGAAVFVVPVFGSDPLAGCAPVGLLRMPFADVIDETGNSGVPGDDAQPGVDQRVDIRLDERLRLHRRNDLRSVDRLTVMADTGGTTGKIGR